MPAQLLKALHPYLAETITHCNLKEWGWFDYISVDSQNSNNPVEVACAALLYLVVGEEGQFLGRHSVFVSVIRFANERTGLQADAAQMQQLVSIFQSPPINQVAVREWFTLVYG